MKPFLRLLVIEDCESDADLLVRLLERAGYEVKPERVEDAEGLRAALSAGPWDVIIADYHLPGFDAPAALRIVREAGLDAPFLVVSAAIGEDLAVRMMKSGAHDYVMKDNLARLVPAVERELGEARTRRERRNAEQALRESEARERSRAHELEAIMDSVPAAVFVAHDAECQKVVGSRMTYELLRLPPGTNLSTTPEDPALPTPRFFREGREIGDEELPLQLAARTARPVPDFEFEIGFEDGKRLQLLGNAVPLLDERGRPRGAVGAFLEVSEREAMEERLRIAQRAESIGLLAGGIAHDFNNILTAVSGNICLAMDLLETDGAAAAGEVNAVLTVAVESVQRAAGLTRQLLAYAGKGAFVREPVSVSKVAEEAIQLMRASLGKKIELRAALSGDLPPVMMDASQLEQVLVNLILNSAEAIGEAQAGSITVSTGGGAGVVWVEVRDTGCGMDGETRKRIFDPFFTTKFMGRGLGLAAVAGIVRSLDGEIQVESEVGLGTRIRVVLPNGEPHAPAAPGGARVAGTGAECGGAVLVVDDEPAIRKMAAALLKKHGLEVLEAATGREAMEILNAQPGIRAVVLDMTMPDLGGDEVLPAILRQRPDVRVIVSSGYGDEEVRRHFGGAQYRSFLPKPYTGVQLLAQVLSALEAGEDE